MSNSANTSEAVDAYMARLDYPLAIARIPSDWLEGDYAARRLAYLGSSDELQARKDELIRIIQHLMTSEDEK
jgi:hypothetical protein